MVWSCNIFFVKYKSNKVYIKYLFVVNLKLK